MARRPAATPEAETKVALPLLGRGGEGGRRCGSCQECCTTLEVLDLSIVSEDGADWRDGELRQLNKLAHERCPHVKGAGSTRCCGIAEVAPEACRKFSCLWLDGMGKTRDRPDRLGVVFTVEPDGAGGLIHMLRESRPDAAKTNQRVIAYAQLLLKEHKDRPIVAAFEDRRHVLYYPPERMAELDKAIQDARPPVDAPQPSP